MGRRQTFIFWTQLETEDAEWLGAEIRHGRLRQGWGFDSLSLVDRYGRPVEFRAWGRSYLAVARGEGWAADDLTDGKVRSRHRILLTMLDIRPGDLLVIPRKPAYDEVAFALAAANYRFDLAPGRRDFGHLIGIDTRSLRVAAYHGPVVAPLVPSFSNYRSAVTPVRNDRIVRLIDLAYAQLADLPTPGPVVTPSPHDADTDNTRPDRVTTAIERIVRDTVKGRALKERYGHACQVCGTSIQLPDRVAYVEVHHLYPLGEPHGGNDDWNNMIVVCPNCHAAFDYGAYRIHPSTLRVHTPDGERGIKFVDGHRLSRTNLERHWRLSGRSAEIPSGGSRG